MVVKLKGYNNQYTIDDNGNVYSNNKKLVVCDNTSGYYRVRVMKGKIRRYEFVHRLVYESFIGPILDGYEVNHIDHDKHNNKPDNLELVTHSENLHKAFLQHGYFGFLNGGK